MVKFGEIIPSQMMDEITGKEAKKLERGMVLSIESIKFGAFKFQFGTLYRIEVFLNDLSIGTGDFYHDILDRNLALSPGKRYRDCRIDRVFLIDLDLDSLLRRKRVCRSWDHPSLRVPREQGV